MATIYLKDTFAEAVTPTTFLQDTFTGTINTLLTAHAADVGGTWAAASNNFKLNGSGGAIPTSTGLCLDTLDATSPQVDATVKVMLASSGKIAALCVRTAAGTSSRITFAIQATTLTLDDGVGTLKTAISFTYTPGQQYTLRVVASGNQILCYLDGVLKFAWTGSSRNTQTLCGILTSGGTDITFTNFTVTKSSNNIALTAHTMDTGAGWTVNSGPWHVDGTGHAIPDFGDLAVARADASHAAATGAIDATFLDNALSEITGIIARASDINNYWLMNVRVSDNTVKLYKIVAGVASELATAAFTPVVGTTYRLKLVTAGNVVTGYIDGVQKVTATDAFNNTATSWGFQGSASTQAGTYQFGNFQVDDGVTGGLQRPAPLTGLGPAGSLAFNPTLAGV